MQLRKLKSAYQSWIISYFVRVCVFKTEDKFIDGFSHSRKLVPWLHIFCFLCKIGISPQGLRASVCLTAYLSASLLDYPSPLLYFINPCASYIQKWIYVAYQNAKEVAVSQKEVEKCRKYISLNIAITCSLTLTKNCYNVLNNNINIYIISHIQQWGVELRICRFGKDS